MTMLSDVAYAGLWDAKNAMRRAQTAERKARTIYQNVKLELPDDEQIAAVDKLATKAEAECQRALTGSQAIYDGGSAATSRSTYRRAVTIRNNAREAAGGARHLHTALVRVRELGNWTDFLEEQHAKLEKSLATYAEWKQRQAGKGRK